MDKKISTKKLTLNKQTIRNLKTKTHIKAGAPKPTVQTPCVHPPSWYRC